jgi:hypothetical protein
MNPSSLLFLATLGPKQRIGKMASLASCLALLRFDNVQQGGRSVNGTREEVGDEGSFGCGVGWR